MVKVAILSVTFNAKCSFCEALEKVNISNVAARLDRQDSLIRKPFLMVDPSLDQLMLGWPNTWNLRHLLPLAASSI